jgi:hypothetical protein
MFAERTSIFGKKPLLEEQKMIYTATTDIGTGFRLILKSAIQIPTDLSFTKQMIELRKEGFNKPEIVEILSRKYLSMGKKKLESIM